MSEQTLLDILEEVMVLDVISSPRHAECVIYDYSEPRDARKALNRLVSVGILRIEGGLVFSDWTVEQVAQVSRHRVAQVFTKEG